MKIENLKVGILAYTIQVDDANGEIVESATEEKPRALLFGMGRIMKSFSDPLRGLQAGDEFTFTITPDNAFGQHDTKNIREVPIGFFVQGGELREDLLQIGKIIKLANKEGQLFDAKIVEVGDKTVIIDFNHPLAGHGLFVKGKVLEVREPTIEEMNEAVEQQRCKSHHCHGNHDCSGEHHCDLSH
jgi:FKBP-type peptidyl-prolyl cis-trans isomerases 2